jgi:hypothetical protein
MLGWLTRRFRKEADGEREHGRIVIQGRPLRCSVCANTSFWTTQVQLDTPITSFPNPETWDRVADCAICERCGHIHWFVVPPATEQSGTRAENGAETLPGAAPAP